MPINFACFSMFLLSASCGLERWVQEDLRIDYDEFIETNRLYPWILKPAEKFRRKIRNVTFGDDW